MLIYVYDTFGFEVAMRMTRIERCEKFGEYRYLSPLDQWEQEEDISLYIIRQPISELSSLIEFLRWKGENLGKRVQQSPKTYFVLLFSKSEWRRNQIRLIKYDFFNKAKVKSI